MGAGVAVVEGGENGALAGLVDAGGVRGDGVGDGEADALDVADGGADERKEDNQVAHGDEKRLHRRRRLERRRRLKVISIGQ